jgi:aspartate/methionine/tyrosine aminotransferase
MSDEIYDHMVYDGETHVCLLSYPQLRERLILLNGWSKTYAMTGWRLGYAVWPGKLYDYARKLAVNLHSCVNAAAQYAGIAALTGPQDAVHSMVAEFDRRRKVVVDGLNKLPGVSCATPKGAFYAFPNVKRTGWAAKALATALLAALISSFSARAMSASPTPTLPRTSSKRSTAWASFWRRARRRSTGPAPRRGRGGA